MVFWLVDKHFGHGRFSLGHFGQAFSQGGTFRTDFFYKKYFLYSGFYFHKIMNGKTFIVHHFYQHLSLQ